MNKNGIHLIPVHNRNEDYQYISDAQTMVVKIVDPDKEHLNRVRRALGANYEQATIILRNHLRSEDKGAMENNPYATGERHAKEWVKQLRELGVYGQSNIWVEGINEPHLDAGPRPAVGTPEYEKWLKQTEYLSSNVDDYTMGLLEGDDGLNIMAYLFSVGWPTTLVPGGDPYWGYFEQSLITIGIRGAAIGLHEYWPEDGPSWNAGWYAYRWKHMPENIPVYITECGMDVYTKHSFASDPNDRGYRKWVTPTINAAMLNEYYRECIQDARFMGFTPFTSDGASEWKSFDMLNSYEDMLRHSWPMGETVPPEPPSKPVKAIWPCAGTITQRWGENYERYMNMFGIPGHNGIDIGNDEGTPIQAIADGYIDWTGYDQDYGNYIRIFHQGLQVHSFYAHLMSEDMRSQGPVTQGETIGRMGSTGNSTGPHLHFEMRAGARHSYTNVNAGHTKGRFNPEVAYYLSGATKAGAT